MSKGRIYFNQSPKPTLGVEAELFIISKESYNLCPGAPVILDDFPDSQNVKEELLESIIEVNTNICNNVADVRKDLTYRISEVHQSAEKENMALISMGTHPFAGWKNQTVTQSSRYVNFLERMQWPFHQIQLQHVHVNLIL
jgi:carboxylate-amine ligase